MLRKRPDERFTAGQALEHVWIKNKAPKAAAVSLTTGIVGHLKAFRAGNKLKKAALHVIATHLDESAIKSLRTLFMQLDSGGEESAKYTFTGEVS